MESLGRWEQHMKLRCREGDLALIIREEQGCGVNIGRAVKVGGPLDVHPVRGPTWLIEPASEEPWTYIAHTGDGVITRPITFDDCIEHPDAWLLPLRPGGGDLAEESKREVQREIPIEVPDHDAVEAAGG
jgi:hypothetical protein